MMKEEFNKEKAHLANIVGETNKLIFDEPNDKKNKKPSSTTTDEDVKKAVENMNPDPNSLESRG